MKTRNHFFLHAFFKQLVNVHIPDTSMYTVSVEDPEKVGEKNSYVMYTVRSTKTADNTSSVQQRRYNDFVWFYEHLKTAHPSCVVPQIPEKTLSLWPHPATFVLCGGLETSFFFKLMW